MSPLGYLELAQGQQLEKWAIRSRPAGAVRLVVLSACESALAVDRPVAEVLGFPDAFWQAGTPAIVASLWSVYDATTSTFMVEFYRRMADERENAVNALQGARKSLATRREGRYAHPFYWAPFLLYGGWR